MVPSPLFRDRHEAGEHLAWAISEALQQLQQEPRSPGLDTLVTPPIVYGLPRGGLPVAAPVARVLGCPLDIVVAKKITRPENPELAIGAVTASGQVLWAKPKPLWEDPALYQAALQQAHEKAQRQMAQFAPARPLNADPEGAIALLVDDGIATGMTIAVAAQALQAQNPAQIWICAPVAPPELIDWLEQWSDRVIVLATPDPFYSVSRFYEEFPQVEFAEAIAYLGKSCDRSQPNQFVSQDR